MNNNTHYRQGDVLLKRVGLLPKGLVKIARDNGRVILAHGEVTGHAHAIADRGTELLRDEAGHQFVRVSGEQLAFTLPILRRWKNQVLVQHPKIGLVEFSVGDVNFVGDQVEVDGEFALLRHDEHNTHAIPAGNYENVRQREFDEEIVRRVAD